MSYHRIDLETYKRRDHFEHFLLMEDPFVNMTVQMEITSWFKRLKEKGDPFFLCFQYAVAKAANRIVEFRQRIQEQGIVEFDVCGVSYTVALPDGTYRYCNLNVDQALDAYIEEGKRKQAIALQTEHLEEEGDPLGLFFISCLPWTSYESLEMPHPNRYFSNPSITWGKYHMEKKLMLENGRVVEKEIVEIPVTVLVNHALVDGIHLGMFYTNLEEELEKMFKEKEDAEVSQY